MEKPYGQRGAIKLAPWRKDAEGRARCRWCDEPIPKGSRRKSWCSDKCVAEWRERGDWSHIRSKIIARDKVCQLCGGQRCHKVGELKANYYRGECSVISWGWDVDHIVAVEDGGTDDPSNLRLLCRRCHKERTAAQRREKALARRSQLALLKD